MRQGRSVVRHGRDANDLRQRGHIAPVVYGLSGAAALFLGVGWVVQQRVAVGSTSHGLVSWTLIVELIKNWRWWAGIAAMTVGQSLSAWALQFGPVSAVEPVLVGFLLVAFVLSARIADQRPRWQEMVGPLVLAATLTVFLVVSHPDINHHARATWQAATIASGVVGVVAAVVVIAGKTFGRDNAPVVEAASLAVAAGLMYGLQDVATRGAIVAVHHHRLVSLVFTLWPWVLLASATAGVLLSQAAFRAERLDYALPPTAAAQPIAGVVVGVVLLGDHLSATIPALAGEAICLLAMLVAVVMIGMSPAFEK
jgi:hypothetical protein